MIFIWGKRTYGAVQKVGDVSVKTVFGHLWYLPLFPLSSHYVEAKTDAAYQLNKINWRSVACSYLRVWMPVIFLLALVFFLNDKTTPRWLSLLVVISAALAFAASYVLDKKYTHAESDEVRRLMHTHFGVAVDPYHCASNLQQEIDGKMQSTSAEPLDHHWYRRTLQDAAPAAAHKELAVLRARCEQHDASLQQTALQQLAPRPSQR